MSAPIIIPNASALDLHVQGTVGSFKVTAPQATGDSSIEVKYLLSHVTLDTTGSHQEKLLSKLMPVREIFDFKDLDFDEIMQRDIDDSRISLDLIKYLLEEGNGGLVKVFPPIVVAVVPVKEGSKNPDKYYPHVTKMPKLHLNDHDYCIVRSGEVGKEAFEFEQLYLNNELSDHNYAKLKLNTSKVELVIVDGQHRAMALLALYRNLKGWPDRASAYEPYYRNWDPATIRKYDLKDLKLPVMLCVFPDIHSGNQSDMSVPKACRSIFLALNKNAKPVSRARNILLDDRNMISEFLRLILSKVKDSDQNNSNLRLHNFQLDSASDNASSLTSAVAFSSVMHLNSLIERLLLSSVDVNGFKSIDTTFHNIKKLKDLLQPKRLNGEASLTSDVIESIRKNNYTGNTLKVLMDEFEPRYADNIVKGFTTFIPFMKQSKASNTLYHNLEGKKERQCISIFFDNQGVEKVFEDYIDRITEQYAEVKHLKEDLLPPGLRTAKDAFDNTSKRIEVYESEFYTDRACELLNASKLSNNLVQIVNDLYQFNFNTTAFQNALFLTFYSVTEKLQTVDRVPNDVLAAWFSEYLESVNLFFSVQKSQFSRVIKVFLGKYKGKFDSEDMFIQENSTSLRNILILGELNPNEWIKFRYIFLELWKSNDENLSKQIQDDLKLCRKNLFEQYFTYLKREKAKDLKKEVDDLTDLQKKNVRAGCVSDIVESVKDLEVNYEISENDFLE